MSETRALDTPLLFGVANSDHQCEGSDPRWPPDIRDEWEVANPRRNATGFWERYEKDVDNAAALGCRWCSVSLRTSGGEWTRGCGRSGTPGLSPVT
jgi:beta-glucosidase/6-phospho-beta-glucosidase/beta-galactosidase